MLNISGGTVVELDLVNAGLGSIRIPPWLLPLVSKKLNPLFDLKSLFMGVPVKNINIEESKIVFGT